MDVQSAHRMRALLLARMRKSPKERASTLPIPDWWLLMARERIHTQGLTQAELGIRLAKAIGRAEPFAHTTVGRFLKGAVLGDDMALAFEREFAMPPPIFIPEDAQEALDMQHVRDRARERRALASEPTRRR